MEWKNKNILFGHSGSGKSKILKQIIDTTDADVIYWHTYKENELVTFALSQDNIFFDMNMPYSIRVLYSIYNYIDDKIKRSKKKKYVLIDNADRYLDRYCLQQLIIYLDKIEADRIIVTTSNKDLLENDWYHIDTNGNIVTADSYESYYNSFDLDKIKNELMYKMASVESKLNKFIKLTSCQYDNIVLNYLKLNIDLTDLILQAEQEIPKYFEDYFLSLMVTDDYESGVNFTLKISMNNYSEAEYVIWLECGERFFDHWLDVCENDKLIIEW